MVDSTKGEDSRYDLLVQTEEVVVLFVLPVLFVGVVLRHRYSAVVQFHLSIVAGVQEQQTLRIRTMVLVPMCLLDQFSPSSMHPAVSRQWENGLIATSGHDCLIGSRIFPLIVAVSVVVECSPGVVDWEVVSLAPDFVAVTVDLDGSYLDVALSVAVAVAFVDFVFVLPVVWLSDYSELRRLERAEYH